MLFSPQDIVDDLEGVSGLVIEKAESVARPVDTPDGPKVAIDALVRLHRAVEVGSRQLNAAPVVAQESPALDPEGAPIGMLLIAIPVGLLIGVSLGALGGGGSILTVPALVYLLNQSPHAATTGSLLIVGITAIAGTVAHLRNGRVRVASGVSLSACSASPAPGRVAACQLT